MLILKSYGNFKIKNLLNLINLNILLIRISRLIKIKMVKKSLLIAVCVLLLITICIVFGFVKSKNDIKKKIVKNPKPKQIKLPQHVKQIKPLKSVETVKPKPNDTFVGSNKLTITYGGSGTGVITALIINDKNILSKQEIEFNKPISVNEPVFNGQVVKMVITNIVADENGESKILLQKTFDGKIDGGSIKIFI